MPADDLGEATRQGVSIERAADLRGRGDVKRGLAGRELIEIPERLLIEGKRCRIGRFQAAECRPRIDACRPSQGVDLFRQGCQGRGFEQEPERDLDSEILPQARHDPRRQQRMAAEK